MVEARSEDTTLFRSLPKRRSRTTHGWSFTFLLMSPRFSQGPSTSQMLTGASNMNGRSKIGRHDALPIFAKAALAHNARLELYIPFDESTFLARSVDFADADWRKQYEWSKQDRKTRRSSDLCQSGARAQRTAGALHSF